MTFFATIHTWLSTFWTWVETALKWILDGFILVLQFVFFTLFDGICTVIEAFFSTLDFSTMVFNYAATWALLPDQLIWLINSVGLPQCFSILGAAYLLRLTLNLIPGAFTRV